MRQTIFFRAALLLPFLPSGLLLPSIRRQQKRSPPPFSRLTAVSRVASAADRANCRLRFFVRVPVLAGCRLRLCVAYHRGLLPRPGSDFRIAQGPFCLPLHIARPTLRQMLSRACFQCLSFLSGILPVFLFFFACILPVYRFILWFEVQQYPIYCGLYCGNKTRNNHLRPRLSDYFVRWTYAAIEIRCLHL